MACQNLLAINFVTTSPRFTQSSLQFQLQPDRFHLEYRPEHPILPPTGIADSTPAQTKAHGYGHPRIDPAEPAGSHALPALIHPSDLSLIVQYALATSHNTLLETHSATQSAPQYCATTAATLRPPTLESLSSYVSISYCTRHFSKFSSLQK